jgi:hypothetical protein
MTQFDRTATPLNASFTDVPDFAKFTQIPNRMALDEMNTAVKTLTSAARNLVIASGKTDVRREGRADPAVITRAAWHTTKPTSSFPSRSFHPDADSDN